MTRGTIGQLKLKAFRRERGLTMEAAGALIVVGGRPVDRATWHGWENLGRLPKPAWMIELERHIGVEPNDFYPRPDGAAAVPAPAQRALAL